jgi:hypothetical protein
MDELDDHSKIDMVGINVTGGACGEQSQKRPEAFAATAHCINDVALNCRIKCRCLLANAPLHFFQMWLNQSRHSSE